MKSLLFSLSLLASSFAFAQNNDVEESLNTDIPMVDATSSAVGYSVRGIYQIKDNTCDPANFKSVRYPGGSDAYIKELKEKLQQNVNWNSYVVNGLFFVKLEAGPKVDKSEPFLNDLKEATKKVNKT